MAIKADEKEFAEHIVDLMQSFGPVHCKRMFGGFGIFLHELMFGLIAESILYLKVDSENQIDFDELDLPAFTYNKNGKEMQMSYFQAPEETLEDSEAMNRWAGIGYAAALRAAAKKKQGNRKK